MASEFIREEQLPRILDCAKAGEAVVVPILLSPALIPPELEKLSSLPIEGRSIAERSDPDKAWAEAARAVKKIASDIEERVWPDSGEARFVEDQPLDIRKVVRALKRAGFEVERRVGLHYVLRDDSDPLRTVVVPRRASSIGGGFLRQILRAESGCVL